MGTEQIIGLAAQLLLFVAISYLIFYRSFIKALGKETAKLVTMEELTTIKETVRKGFNEGLEAYKKELDKNNIAYQIQFSHLHQERAKIILELYQKLQELHSAMVDWTGQMHPIVEDKDKEEANRAERATKAIFDFKNYYLLNQLYFSRQFCQSIGDLFKEYWSKGYDYGFKASRIQTGQLNKEILIEYYGELSKISKEVRDELPKKIEELEVEFRKMLAVEN